MISSSCPKASSGSRSGTYPAKGIGAALLMASLEASLRGQALVAHDLAELMNRVNSLVLDASSANRYATLFYAAYDPRSRQLVLRQRGSQPAGDSAQI